MRECIFLLADTNMRATFEGFFTRPAFHQRLGCGTFDFDVQKDIKVAAGDNDPGLYTRGHELLRPFQKTHQRAVMVMDAAWAGSPGADAIKQHMAREILSTGWKENTFQVIVIDPELENWIWQKNDHVASGLGFANITSLLADSDIQDSWPQDAAKPDQPKEVLEKLLKKRKLPRSSAIYKRITSKVSVQHCQDGSFQELLATLRSWFPVEGI